jgi:hypothetical protein
MSVIELIERLHVLASRQAEAYNDVSCYLVYYFSKCKIMDIGVSMGLWGLDVRSDAGDHLTEMVARSDNHNTLCYGC